MMDWRYGLRGDMFTAPREVETWVRLGVALVLALWAAIWL